MLLLLLRAEEKNELKKRNHILYSSLHNSSRPRKLAMAAAGVQDGLCAYQLPEPCCAPGLGNLPKHSHAGARQLTADSKCLSVPGRAPHAEGDCDDVRSAGLAHNCWGSAGARPCLYTPISASVKWAHSSTTSRGYYEDEMSYMGIWHNTWHAVKA